MTCTRKLGGRIIGGHLYLVGPTGSILFWPKVVHDRATVQFLSSSHSGIPRVTQSDQGLSIVKLTFTSQIKGGNQRNQRGKKRILQVSDLMPFTVRLVE